MFNHQTQQCDPLLNLFSGLVLGSEWIIRKTFHICQAMGSENISTLAAQPVLDQEIIPHSGSDHFAENLSTYA